MIAFRNEKSPPKQEISRWDNEGGAPRPTKRVQQNAKITALKNEIRYHNATINALLGSGQECPDASLTLQRKKDALSVLQRAASRWPRLHLNFNTKATATEK
jgi:hypothetical protein